MKRIYRILVWVLFLFALFIVVAYFLPKVITVERQALIDASKKLVFAQINDLHNWDKWSKWNQLDPEMEIEYQNSGIGENSGYTWHSENKNVGNGSLTILESVKYDSITMVLDFMEQGSADACFYFNKVDSGTNIKWTFKYDVGYNPFQRWMGLLVKKFVGNDFEEGLSNLQTVCKVLVEENAPVIEIGNSPSFNYASIRKTVPWLQISDEMGNLYGQISMFLQKTGSQMGGMPYSVYHSVNTDSIDLECGIPLTIPVEGNNTIKVGNMEAHKCATHDFYGDYNNLPSVHTAIQEWLSERDIKTAGPPMEVYETDPGAEPDPSKWLTKIYYPIK